MSITDGELAQKLDVRPASIDTKHLRDDAVATAKIPDLAITFPDKIDNPIWVDTQSELLFHNAGLDTVPTLLGSMSVDVPAWVNGASIFASAYVQLSNTSGATQLISAGIAISEEVVGGNSMSVVTGTTGLMSFFAIRDMVNLAGSSFVVNMEVSVGSGTNSANHGSVYVIVVGHR